MAMGEQSTCPFCNDVGHIMDRQINGLGLTRRCCVECASRFRKIDKPEVLK